MSKMTIHEIKKHDFLPDYMIVAHMMMIDIALKQLRQELSIKDPADDQVNYVYLKDQISNNKKRKDQLMQVLIYRSKTSDYPLAKETLDDYIEMIDDPVANLEDFKDHTMGELKKELGELFQ